MSKREICFPKKNKKEVRFDAIKGDAKCEKSSKPKAQRKMATRRTKADDRGEGPYKTAQGMADGIKRRQDKMAPDQVELQVQHTNAAGAPVPTLADTAERTPGNASEQFPTTALGAKEKRDELMSMRLELADQQGVTPFGIQHARDKDFEWLARKKKAAEYANMQQWFAQEYDKADPASKKVARELFPTFYKQRQRTLDQNVENLRKLAKLKLNGIQSKEDLFTQYLAETGRLDTGVLDSLLNPEKRKNQLNKQRFKRGLLNAFRLFGDEGPNPNMITQRSQNANAFRKQPAAAAAPGIGLGIGTGFPPYLDGYAQNQQNPAGTLLGSLNPGPPAAPAGI